MQIARVFAGVFAIIFLAFGIIAGIKGAEDKRKADLLAEHSVHTKAEILLKYEDMGHRRENEPTRIPDYMVRYKFTLQDGTDFEVTEEIGRNFYETIVPGTIYNVTYSGSDPSVATLYESGFTNTSETYAEIARIALIIGAILLAFAFWPRIHRLLGGRPRS